MFRGVIAVTITILAAVAVLTLHRAPVANSVRDAYSGGPPEGRIVPLAISIHVKRRDGFDIVSGTVQLPSTSIDLVRRSRLCVGSVTVKLRQGPKVISQTRQPLTDQCRYRAELDVGTRDGETLRARFNGNKFVAPVRSRFAAA